MIDEWIVGDAGEPGRSYVVHNIWPRFTVELVEADEGDWRVGCLSWQDDLGPMEATHWTRAAGDVFLEWLQTGSE